MQDAYTFTLNENIAFDHDYPIKEMLGIGLEPVLSIQEMGETLSIRGVMELKGEYIISEERGGEEVINGQDVERIEMMSDDLCEFFHKFVMDISIPMERVNEVNSVVVDVDHFDYSIESDRCLSIEAVLAIKGLSQNTSEIITAAEEEQLPRFETEEKIDEPLIEEESFQFVVNEEQQPEPVNQEINNNVTPLSNEFKQDNEPAFEELREVSDDQSVSEEIAEQTAEQEAVEEIEEVEEEVKEERLRVQARAETEDTSYLLNIFAEEEDTAYTRLKLYIVQPTDQMTSIAEKYNVTPRQIMRTNQLEDEDLSSGQLIYIPVTSEE
ncbi:LysM peptidoglycan-binding domain-containing protein [Gracilibacillus oryzae]|uniref:LysM peptidoglycan-binding domain-containing protein n=1 Tax=Gracilibacillus oryzae TaxID=1672701 RepID=UPI001886150D|nr:LysM peptidoglycan-binding domain-containing protein [Gracilibacillus oryzae]